MNTLNVALIQTTCKENRIDNMHLLEQQIHHAVTQGAQLVVLPELHNGLYFCQTEDLTHFDRAETIPGPSTDRFGELALELGVVLVISLFEKRAAGIYHNTAVVIDSDGTIAGTYRKMHIPDDPGYHEKFYFTPGDPDFSPIKTSVGTLGVLVCWDQWYPEAARLMALAGADMLIYPTAIGWDPHDDEDEQQRQLDAWRTVQRGHAIANGLPVVAVNRTGFETDPSGATAGAQFWGNSFVAGPQGELLSAAGGDPEVVIAAIDFNRSEKVRQIWPFLRDRRIDAYQDILKRYRDQERGEG
ncbi:MAG: carbon-nitrogen hydrolase [Desulfuromonadaceae bacterium]|nr:carbon-nitrogen hydrolase [Desulfuromonadaceae bacterium]